MNERFKKTERVKCGNCVFFEPSGTRYGLGWCHRYPNVGFETWGEESGNKESTNEFTVIHCGRSDWCGEFQDDESTDA